MEKNNNPGAMISYLQKQEYLLVFIVATALLSLLHLHPSLPDPDSFYHARIAAEMLRGLNVPFSALPFTALANIFIDHHFLYHVVLIPFVTLFDPLIGIKIATVLFAAGFLTFFYWLIRTFAHARPRVALCFLALLILNTVFLFRINLAKIPSVSLIVFFAGLYAIMKEKYAHLFGLSFLYVWLYGGWPLLPFSSCAAWIIRAACARGWNGGLTKNVLMCGWGSNTPSRRFDEGSPKYRWGIAAPHSLFRILFSRQHVTLPLASFSGALAGLIINPFFPTNIFFYWIQTFKIALLNILSAVPVGGEWYPPGLSFIPVHGPTLMLLVWSLCAFFLPGLFSSVFKTVLPQRSWQQWFLCALTIAFFILTLKSRRYGEYFAPLAILFSVLVLAPLLSDDLFKRFVRVTKNALAHPRTLSGVIAIYFLIAGPFIASTNLWQVVQSFRSDFAFTRYERGVSWLTEHLPAGSTIFHHRWDDFPLLYYRAPDYHYISGLDARFFYEKDAARAERYTTFASGDDLGDTFGYRALCSAALFSLRADGDSKKGDVSPIPLECTPPEEMMRAVALIQSFDPAAIVITNHDFPLEKKILAAPGWSEVYRDDEMIIMQSQE